MELGERGNDLNKVIKLSFIEKFLFEEKKRRGWYWYFFVELEGGF